ncbi:MAG: hypothetical protein V4559_17615 [Pseudomonadota bacterium]
MKNTAPRLTGFCLALMIQVGFVAMLIWSRPVFVKSAPAAHELMLMLPHLPLLPARPASRTVRNITPSEPAAKTPPSQNAPSNTPPRAALEGFGQALNGCAPETYDRLPPEQRAACASRTQEMAAFPSREPNLMGAPSRVKNEAIWQAELARAHSPALLPCLGGLDVMCMLMKMADGSLSDFGDPKTWPIYQTKQLPPEDFYKIEQAYSEWHKDHPAQ